MNKKTMKIAGWALGLSLAVAGIGMAVGTSAKGAVETRASYATATAATMTAGTNGSDAEVNGHAAIKVGTSSKGGDMSITVPAGTAHLYFYAAAWKGVSNLSLELSMTVGSASTDSFDLTADDGVSNNSPFTLSGSENSFLFETDLSGVTAESTITLASSISKRFVVWGAKTEAAPSVPTISLSANTLELNGTESKNVSVTFGALTENISVAQTSDNGGEVTISSSISKDASSPYTFAVSGKSAGTVDVTFSSAGAESKTLTVTVTDWAYSDLELTTDENFVDSYYVDSEFDPSGIMVNYVETSTFPGGTRKTDVTEDATFNFDSSTAGSRKLIATYDGHSTDDMVFYLVSEVPEADLVFGSASGSLNVNAASVSKADANGKTWTVTTAGTTSFTPNAAYAQIGSSKGPATSITFSATIADSLVNVTSFSAKFGGFNGTSGTVTLKVGDETVGTGSLNATSDVVVSSSKPSKGTVLTITVTSISKGVKAYWLSYETKTDKEVVEEFVTKYMHMEDYDSGLSGAGDGSCAGYYPLAKAAYGKLTDEQIEIFVSDSDFSSAKARFKAWAEANDDAFDPSTGVLSAAHSTNLGFSSKEAAMPLVVTVAALGTAAAAGFFLFQRKRKEN